MEIRRHILRGCTRFDNLTLSYMAHRAKNLTILFALEEGAHFFYYKSAVRELARRGHKVRVLFAKRADGTALDPVYELKREYPSVEHSRSFYRSGVTRKILLWIRAILNYRRFLTLPERPDYYRRRLITYLPFWMQPLVKSGAVNVNFLIKRQWVWFLLHRLDQAISPDARISAQIKEYAPDAVVASSGNLLSSSPDFEYLRAARRLGIPTALSIMSWDYLETKGVVHVLPDRLLVWNALQEEEARMSHRIPADSIRITGVSYFDDLFSLDAPLQSREEFCAEFGIDPARPYLLYIGSSGIFGDETWFLRGIRDALARDPRTKHIQIIVRPHHKNFRIYKKNPVPDAALVPREGRLPALRESLELFHDSMYHALAVVGIGTSGFIDAMIAGKPVLTVLTDFYHDIQREAPHFKHLIREKVFELAGDFSEVPEIVVKLSEGKDQYRERRINFLKKYIRPLGLECPAAEAIADEIEALVKR